MKKRLPLWLAVIFAAFNLIVIGGVFLEMDGGSGGEGAAFAVFFYDLPLFVLFKNIPIHGHADYGPRTGKLILLLSGMLMYALIGFIIGAAINWIRGFMARHWGER